MATNKVSLCKNANVAPSHSTRVLCGTNPPNCAKTRSPRKISLNLGGSHPGRMQAQQGKGEEMTRTQMPQGCQPPTYRGHPLWCIVQPMDANPSATLRPKPKPVTQKPPPKGYPNGGSHPIGWTWQPSPMSTGFHPTSPTTTQTAVAAAVKQRVPVKAAVDSDPAITAWRVGLDKIPSSACQQEGCFNQKYVPQNYS